MFYKKKGSPEVDDIVICTVKKILYHSVFVSLDGYENVEGMIHISEIAPGRIRNLRDYVVEGKKIVCKVLNKNPQGNIDLSLRRVPTTQMVKKLNDYKQEEKAEKLFEQIGKDFKMDLNKIYSTIGNDILDGYGSLYAFLQAVVEKGKPVINELKINQEFADALYKTIVEKIKPVEVRVSGKLILRSYKENGVETIRNILIKLSEQKINVQYLGAPNYKLEVISKDYRNAENILKNGLDFVFDSAKNHGCEVNFTKND